MNRNHIKYLLIFLLITNNSILKSKDFSGYCNLGFSASQVSGDNLGGFNKAGIILGGFVSRKINTALQIQIEMMYIQKGSSNPKPENLIGEINLEYIEIPILFSFNSSEDINLDLGLHISALIESYYEDLYGIMENQIEFENFELGALIGISYQLNQNFSLCTRLSNSIIPIADHASGQTYRLNLGKYNTGLNFIIKYKI